MSRTIGLLMGIALLAPSVPGEELRRRGTLGMVLGAADGKPGVLIQQVVPGSAAAEAGLETGDRIRSVDGAGVDQPLQVSTPRRFVGDVVRVTVVRREQELTRILHPKPRPYETSPRAEVLYRTVTVRGRQRRVILNRPNTPGLPARLPAVVLMHGLGCYSMDGLGRKDGYGRLIEAFEEKGYVTMRVEKTGEGDSDGPLCSDVAATPELEAEGYTAAIAALVSYDFVDPAAIFVFAHSMGPVVGSLVLPNKAIRGWIAVETVGTSWFEYDLERHRLQQMLSGDPADEVERRARQYDKCSYRFYVMKETPEQLAKTGCETLLTPFGTVPYTYMQAVADINVAAQWKNADMPVLVVFGTSSPVTTAYQNRYLATVINSFHPGRAAYVEVPRMSHDFARYESMAEYLQRDPAKPHPFHEGLLEVVLPWLDRQRQGEKK